MIKCCLKENRCTAVYFDGTNYKELYDTVLRLFDAVVVFNEGETFDEHITLKKWVTELGSFDPFGISPARIEVPNFTTNKTQIITANTWVVADATETDIACYTDAEFRHKFVEIH